MPDTSKWEQYKTKEDKWAKYATKKSPPVEEGTGAKLWEAANRPMFEERFRKQGVTGGIPQSMRFAVADMVGKMNISDENKKRLAMTLDIPLELITAPAEAARRAASPLGFATTGAGSLLQKLRQLTGVPTALKAVVAGTEGVAGGAFGAQAATEAAKGRQKQETGLEEFERRVGALGQSLLGMTALGHAGGPAAAEGTRKSVRSISDVGPQDIATAEKAAATTAKEKARVFENEATAASVQARAEYEAKEAARQAETAKITEKHAADVAAAKAKHAAELESYEQSISGSVTKEAHAKLKNARMEKAEKAMTESRDQAAKDLTRNLDQAEATEHKQLDQRYTDYNKKVFGVTDANPNGTAKSELSPVGDAIQYAKKNIMKGSQDNVKVFNNIMGELHDMVEGPEGELKPVAGQFVPTTKLLGFEQELGSAIYDRELPFDVRESLKHVQKAIRSEVNKTVLDTHGQTAVDVHDQLSKDWSEYKRIWYDQSSASPIPKIRKMLRDINVEKSGVEVYQRIAKMVKGEAGRAVVKLLAEKTKFGADPRLPARVMALDEKLGSLGKLFEKVPVTKYPRVPKAPDITAPELPKEPTSARVWPPKPPEIEPFNRQEFIKEGVAKRAKLLGHIGTGFALATTIGDILHGKPGAAMSTAERIALVQALKALATSPKFLDWVAREGGSRPTVGAPAIPQRPPEPPTGRPGGVGAPPSPPTRPGPMGGINAAGYETSLRPVSLEQKVQALRDEFQDLQAKIRKAPAGPEKEQAIRRLMQNIELIAEMEKGGGK